MAEWVRSVIAADRNGAKYSDPEFQPKTSSIYDKFDQDVTQE